MLNIIKIHTNDRQKLCKAIKETKAKLNCLMGLPFQNKLTISTVNLEGEKTESLTLLKPKLNQLQTKVQTCEFQ